MAFLALLSCGARADGIIDAVVTRFAQSDFEFIRAKSNVPFLPIAWLAVTGYQEGQFDRPDGTDSGVTFQQSSISQGAFAPIPVGKRDAFVIGEWISQTHFDLRNAASADLDVLTATIPMGWIRQPAPDWQVAAFVAPMGHRTHEDDWYWETLGGAFARHTTSDRVAWIFGVYFDVSPLEDFYTPYLGATFTLSEQWMINAVMPWPSINYAPNADTLFQLGVTPSGTSWSIEPNEHRPRISLSAWNFGLAAERRIYKSVWLRGEVGI